MRNSVFWFSTNNPSWNSQRFAAMPSHYFLTWHEMSVFLHFPEHHYLENRSYLINFKLKIFLNQWINCFHFKSSSKIRVPTCSVISIMIELARMMQSRSNTALIEFAYLLIISSQRAHGQTCWSWTHCLKSVEDIKKFAVHIIFWFHLCCFHLLAIISFFLPQFSIKILPNFTLLGGRKESQKRKRLQKLDDFIKMYKWSEDRKKMSMKIKCQWWIPLNHD